MMVEEIAEFRIHAGQQAAFEKALHQGVNSVIGKAQGFLGYSLNRSVESPERYLLKIQWKTLEDHTVGFRESALFVEWRAIVGPFFASAPQVEHFVRA